jgi:RHS repeat-associated protein
LITTHCQVWLARVRQIAYFTPCRATVSRERGSIIAASNASGVAASSVKYTADGESGTLAAAFGYTGQLYLPDLQLYYYKARMYSPKAGRFLQPDPIGYGGGMNVYGYVGNDPVNRTDPSGLCWQLVSEFWWAVVTTDDGSENSKQFTRDVWKCIRALSGDAAQSEAFWDVVDTAAATSVAAATVAFLYFLK